MRITPVIFGLFVTIVPLFADAAQSSEQFRGRSRAETVFDNVYDGSQGRYRGLETQLMVALMGMREDLFRALEGGISFGSAVEHALLKASAMKTRLHRNAVIDALLASAAAQVRDLASGGKQFEIVFTALTKAAADDNVRMSASEIFTTSLRLQPHVFIVLHADSTLLATDENGVVRTHQLRITKDKKPVLSPKETPQQEISDSQTSKIQMQQQRPSQKDVQQGDVAQ